MKKKVLVLENLNVIEDVCAAYLTQNFDNSKYDVEIIHGLRHVSPTVLIDAFKVADILVVQSLFLDDEMRVSDKQVAQIVNLIQMLNKKIEIHLIHGHNENALLKFLNLELTTVSLYKDIVKLIEEGQISLYKVEFKVMEDAQKKTYFRSLFYFFDAIKLYYNKETDLIWQIRPTLIIPTDRTNLFLQKAVWVNKDGVESIEKKYNKLANAMNSLSNKEVKLMYAMFEECRAKFDYDMETIDRDLEGEDDLEEIKERKQGWLDILNKLI